IKKLDIGTASGWMQRFVRPRRECLKIFSESGIYGPPHRIPQIGEESGVGAIARLLPTTIEEVYNQPSVFSIVSTLRMQGAQIEHTQDLGDANRRCDAEYATAN